MLAWLKRWWRRHLAYRQRCEDWGAETREWLGRLREEAKTIPWLPPPDDADADPTGSPPEPNEPREGD